MALPSLRTLAARQQDELLGFEEALQDELVQSYRSVAARLDEETARFVDKIAQARARGEKVSESWLFQERRLQLIQEQVIDELEQYGVYVEDRVAAMQHSAALLGEDYSHELMMVGVGRGGNNLSTNFAGLPTQAVEAIVGKLQHDGTPLAAALEKYPALLAKAIRKELVVSVALGYSPRKTAQLLSKTVGGAASDYLTLARTEVVGAHRSAALETYKQNRGIVEGWEWLLGKSDACEFCRSKTGHVYSLETPFRTHPSCRCSCIPTLKGT